MNAALTRQLTKRPYALRSDHQRKPKRRKLPYILGGFLLMALLGFATSQVTPNPQMAEAGRAVVEVVKGCR